MLLIRKSAAVCNVAGRRDRIFNQTENEPGVKRTVKGHLEMSKRAVKRLFLTKQLFFADILIE